jgi:manganese transport protein
MVNDLQVAIVPAVIVAGVSGPQAVGKLLVLSQVILSLQLPFAVFPLVQFTSSRGKMGSSVNRWYIKTVGWALTAIIAGLNVYLIIQSIRTNEFSAATVA